MRLYNYLNEKRKSERMIMYHGTSSEFLSKIKNKGLQYKGKDIEKVWDTDQTSRVQPSRVSLEGIYLTANIMTASSSANAAKNKFGGNPLYVIVIFQPLSGLPDEDILTSTIRGSIDKTIKNNWGNVSNTFDQLTYVEMILSSKADQYIESFKQTLLRDIEIMNDVKIDPRAVKDSVLEQLFLAELERRISYDVQEKGMLSLSGFKKAWDLYPKSNVDDVMNNVPEPNEAEKNYLKMIDKATRMFKKVRTNRSEFIYNLRSTEPIGYKGRNRIISIVEEMGKGDNNEEILKVHYGKVPDNFKKDFTRLNDNFKFV